jgi:energy-coupling factor transporter transmembrane protein EcfT
MFPGLFGMALAWVVFNPSPASDALLHVPVYSGTIALGITLRTILFVAFAVTWYILRRGVFWGIVGGLALAATVTVLFDNPGVVFARFDVYHPLAITISKQNLVVAITKSLGYGAMMLLSLMLMMTSRDVEVTGAMRQLRVPHRVSFFVSTMLRSLSMALTDYSTIRQAQVARGISLKKKNILHVLADLAAMSVPLTATMLRRANEVGDAALARGFSLGAKSPAEFREIRRFAPADWIAIGVCILLGFLIIVCRLSLTRLFGVVW